MAHVKEVIWSEDKENVDVVVEFKAGIIDVHQYVQEIERELKLHFDKSKVEFTFELQEMDVPNECELESTLSIGFFKINTDKNEQDEYIYLPIEVPFFKGGDFEMTFSGYMVNDDEEYFWNLCNDD